MDCIFCKIIAGSIPSDKVYEDAAVLAFLDIAPISRGHTLIIPKSHYPDLVSTPAAITNSMMLALRKIAPALGQVTGAPDFNVGINHGPAAGQIVMHTHFHLIPRRSNDGLRSWPHGTYGTGEGDQLATAIRAALRAA